MREKMEPGELQELKMEAKEYGMKVVKPKAPKKPTARKPKALKKVAKPKAPRKKKVTTKSK